MSFKTNLFISLAILMVMPLVSQPQYGGVWGGLSISNLAEDPREAGISLNKRAGFAVGGVGIRGLSEIVFLQISPSFVQRGSTVKGRLSYLGETIETEQDWKFSYVEVPVGLRLRFQGLSGPAFYVFGGGYGAVLISAKARPESVTINGVPQDIEQEESDLKDFFKKYDFGLNLGGGFEFGLGGNAPDFLFVEGAVSIGLANIAENDPEDEQVRIGNIAFMMRVGLLFSVGGSAGSQKGN